MCSKRISTRIIAAILVVVMMLPIGPFTVVQAAETVTLTGTQFTIGTNAAIPGEAVELIATLENAPLIKSMAISDITYDTSKMTLTNVEWLCDAEIKNWNSAQGRGVLTFGENTDANGPVLKMTFKINEVVEDSAVSISCSVILKTMDANSDEVPVETTVIPGKVEIRNEIRGDMDSNEKVNSDDAVYLLYHTLFGKEEYPIKQSGDIDGNGKTNSDDAVYLLYHTLFGEEEYPLFGVCTHTGMTAVAAKNATCTEDGNIAYWHCSKCNKYFSDVEATTEIAYANTAVDATGHQNVTAMPEKEATYEEDGNHAYWYCSDCEKYFSDEACETVITYNDTVIPAKGKYGITYYLYDNNDYLEEVGVDNPNPAWYDPEVVLVLENPAKAGFRFDGWYDAEGASGELVKQIAPGETGDKKLYARWSLVEYTVSYKDDVYNVNYADDTYTVDKRKILTLPEQRGLLFVGWEDSEGNIYRELPKGMTGNLELKAKWKSHLYIATPYDDKKEVEPFYYDEAEKTYYFVYSLGTLEGIPLENLIADVNVFKHTGAGSTTLSWTETVTVEESRSEFIGKTISTSTSQSEQWGKTIEKANSSSSDESFDVTVGAEIGVVVKAKLEGTYGQSHSTTDSYSETTVKGGLKEEGSEESDESSVTLSYLNQLSTTKGTDINISADSPVGYYTYAKLGNAKVYGIVAFNGETGNYSLSTYSILEYAYDTHLYFPSKASLEESMNNPTVETLPFNVPIADIIAYVNENYYVNYDGNGGQYSYTLLDETMENSEPVIVDGMPLSTFAIGTSGTLSKNQYTRTGYSFAGWSLTKDGTAVYTDCAEITVDASEKAKVLTLYAVWEPIEYTITYETNGGSISGDYTAIYTVESANINLPALIHDTYPEYNRVLGWYFDADCTLPYVADYTTNPRDMTLYAKWYTVYDSIDSTPSSIAGKVIIDWRSETDTDLLNHTDRIVSDGNYNTLNIGNETTEVTFIGDPEKVYTNFRIQLSEFSEDQKLTIRFVDFNFTTNEITAIGLYNDGGVDLTIEVIGDCSIDSTYKTAYPTSIAGSIIGDSDNSISNLTFDGSGTMRITAGDGKSFVAWGYNGSNGGVAVYANTISVSMDGTLIITGGNGGDGQMGGGNGGSGGSAIFANTVMINSGTVEIYGGNGGNGGDGGDGQNGWSASGQCDSSAWPSTACKGDDGAAGKDGGDGGNGGSGASAISMDAEVIAAGNAVVLIKSGSGGNGGNGGDGGDGGKGQDGGDGWSAVGYVDGHDGGNGGNGGIGGNGGNGGTGGEKTTNVTAKENAIITVSSGNYGNGGNGGDGGDGGAGGKGGNSSEQLWNHRWGGNGGNGGNAANGGNGGDGLVAGTGGVAGKVGAAGSYGCDCRSNGTPGKPASLSSGSSGAVIDNASTDVYTAATGNQLSVSE